MLYLINGDKIICYKVSIDEEKLEIIRLKIIYNCSLLTDVIKETTASRFSDNERYIVHSKREVDRVDHFYYDTIIYEVLYQELIHPPIVEKIKQILNGNYDEIVFLFDNENLKDIKMKEYEVKQKMISCELSKLNVNSSQYQFSKLSDEIQTLRNMYTFKNLDTVCDVSKYYEDLVSCIILTKIKEIDKKTFYETRGFLSETKFNCPSDFHEENDNVKKLIKSNK